VELVKAAALSLPPAFCHKVPKAEDSFSHTKSQRNVFNGLFIRSLGRDAAGRLQNHCFDLIVLLEHERQLFKLNFEHDLSIAWSKQPKVAACDIQIIKWSMKS
jgi:hypothetical protein